MKEDVKTEVETNYVQLIKKHENDGGALILLLQVAQERDGFIKESVIYELSEKLDVPVSEIYGVITFYSQFRLTPLGKYVIRICEGTACHVNGGKAIIRTLVSDLGIDFGQTTKDGLFSLEAVACLGCCSLAPVVMINDETHGNLTPELVRKILSEYKKQK